MITLEATTQTPELFRPDRWVDHMADGTVVLLDPANGTELRGAHTWIEEDSRLHDGREFLGRIGSQAAVYIEGGVHEEAADLGPDFERTVARHAAFGFEAFGWSAPEHEEELDQLRRTGQFDRLLPVAEFEERIMRAAAVSQAPSFSYDVEESDHPLDTLLCEMMRGVKGYSYIPEIAALDKSQVDELTFALGVMRQEYWPGKLGHELQRASFAAGGIYLTMGAAHEVVTVAQLEAYNMPVQSRLVPSRLVPADIIREEIAVYTRTFQQRRASSEEVHRRVVVTLPAD